MLRAGALGVAGAVAGCSGTSRDAPTGTPTDGPDEPAWPTFFGGAGNRSFAATATGPGSTPSVEVEAAVHQKDWRPMTALVSDGVAWNQGLRRVSLADGGLEDGAVENAWPLAVTPEGAVASVPTDVGATVALYDDALDRQWATQVAAETSPVLGDGALFAGRRREDGDVVRAVDLDDGAVRWEYPVRGELSGVAYSNGTVLVTGEDAGTGHLDAVDAATGDGRRLWSHELPDSDSFVPSPPVVAQGTVFLARQRAIGSDSPPPALFALDAADGTERWSVRRTVAAMPVVTDDLVYSAGVGYDPADGNRRWKLPRELSDSLEGSIGTVQPAATSERLYFAEVDPADYTGYSLFSVGTADGTLRWRREFEPGAFALRVVAARLVVGTNHGEVYVLA